MKKRFIALTAALCVAVCALFAFVACTGKKSEKSSPVTITHLTYEKRYIDYTDIGADEDEQDYLTFHTDGTGSYTVSGVNRYTVRFAYTYTEGGLLHCFYLSVTGNTSVSAELIYKWRKTFSPSPEVLYEITEDGGKQYVCETYLPTIPDFGKFPTD